jgi:eukaryotic-like serine/threonine-protein kinase
VAEQQILVGRYRLDDPLGEGGMSVVWRAFDLVLGRPVAVKVLSGSHADNDHFRTAIRGEAQTAAKVSHPNLASVYDYGESVDEAGHALPFVVMELLTGPTLAQRLVTGPIPSRTVLRICAAIADGLALAHAHGLVHRDVKPGNVVLSPSGPKLVDFGVATFAGAPEATGPGDAIIGTPSYVAPERLLGGRVLPASDVYSLGAMLFRSLTGRLPWPPGMPTVETRARPAELPSLDGVASGINDLYRRCVELDPDQRPTARQAATILAAAIGVRPVSGDAHDADPSADPSADPPGDPHGDKAAVPVRPADPAEPGVASPWTRNHHRRGVAVLVAVPAAAIAGIIVVGGMNGAELGPPPRADRAFPTAQAPGVTATPPPDLPVPPGPTGADPPGVAITNPVWITQGGVAGPVADPGGQDPGGAPAGTSQPPNQPPTQPPVQPRTRTFTSPGGTAVVTCSGSLAHLDSWSPAAGYSVPRPPRQGPATTVEVVFRSRNTSSTISAWCSNGQPDGQVTTSQGPTPPTPTPSRRPR